MVDTAETIGTALSDLLQEKRKPKLKFSVVERDYNRERIVFSTDDRKAAEKVAGEHGARRVISNGQA